MSLISIISIINRSLNEENIFRRDIVNKNTRGSSKSFVLTDVTCIENALKGTEIVFVLAGNSY